MVEIVQLNGEEAASQVPALAGVLLDCVAGGASVGFMASLTRESAEAYFAKWVRSAQLGERVLLGAFVDGALVGTVQVLLSTAPNQPHRADIAKMLVTRAARGRGIGALLLTAAEEAARLVGKSLLVLDTVSGSAGERLYARLGWTRAGSIPDYALFPDGRFCDTTIFWKKL